MAKMLPSTVFALSRRILGAASIVAVLAWLFPSAASGGAMGEPVLRWQDRSPSTTSTEDWLMRAAKLLPDGTLVVVLDGPSVARFQPGSQISTAVALGNPGLARNIVIDDCGDVLVGAVRRLNTSDADGVWLMKFDSTSGRPLWSSPFVWEGVGVLADVLTDAEGNVLVTASSPAGYVSRKLDGVDGGTLWTSPQVPNGQSTRVFSAVDESGDFYLTAQTRTPTITSQIGAWSLDGATGGLVWGPLGFDTSPGSLEEEPFGIQVDSGGGVVIGANPGFVEAVILRIQSGNGAVEWGPIQLANIYLASEMAVGAAGTLFVAGLREVTPNSSELVVAGYEIDSGVPSFAAFAFAPGPSNAVPSLVPASNGDVIVTVIFGSQASGFTLQCARLGPDGAVAWGPESRGDVSSASPLSLLEPDGSLVELFALEFTADPPWLRIARRNAANGQTTQAPASFSGMSDEFPFFDARVSPDGNLFVASRSTAAPEVESSLRKIDRVSGEVLWGISFAGSVSKLAVDAAGDVVAIGGSQVWKFAGSDGAALWGPVAIAAPGSARFVEFDAGGDLVLVSVTGNFPRTTYVEKRSATGALLWGPVARGGGEDFTPVGLALDPGGNPIVSVTHVIGDFDDTEWFTFKLSGSSGTGLWTRTYRVNGIQTPHGLATTPNGDVVVFGRTFLSSHTDMLVFRYSGATGAVVWGPRIVGGPSGTNARPANLAIDVAGNVFMTGNSYVTALSLPGVDALIVKLDGATGAPLWEPTSWDTGRNEYARSLALTASGDPVVAITSEAYDDPVGAIHIVSWDSANGSPLWGPITYDTMLEETAAWVGISQGTILLAGGLFESLVVGSLAPRTTLVLAYVETLGIETPPGELIATCGETYVQQLEAANVNGTATWTAVGALPDGLLLSSEGLLFGTPVQIGEFPITVQVQDSTLATAARDLTIVVREGPMTLIVALPVDDCTWQLSVPGGWTSHAWEPGNETTPTITVSPLHDAIYGVTLGDGSGCTVRGSILVRATRLIDPDCDAPGLSAIDPTSGPAAGGTDLTLSGSGFETDSQVRIGGLPAATTFQDSETLISTTSALEPGTLHHILVTNTNQGTAFLPFAFFADFLDVDQSHLFHDFVEALVRAQVTAGCGVGNYCPDDPVTRAQMAVFLLVSKNGPGYVPPPATGTVFNDVGATDFAAAFIEALFAAQVTGGCGGGNYCPNSPATREQMAVFLLRTLEGPTYTPPACTSPPFADVPCSSIYAAWIQEISTRGITGGCGGGNFCPTSPVSRGQMAVFLTVTFGL